MAHAPMRAPVIAHPHIVACARKHEGVCLLWRRYNPLHHARGEGVLHVHDGLGAIDHLAFTQEARNASQQQDVSILGRDLMLLVLKTVFVTHLLHRQEGIAVFWRLAL